jgi:predicted metal-dependent hydrolase
VQLDLPFVSSNLQFYFVRHKRARRYLLRVDGDGRVRVTIPRGGSQREAAAFGLRHLDWISTQQLRCRSTTPGVADTDAQRARASVELRSRLLELATAHGVTVSRVTVRDQRTRWGSCGRDGHISVNWRLVLMPAWVRDYVLIHELMHLRRMDHSRRYWRLVAEACPEYQEARRWLREHGPSLR